jgi:hypothetical protein
VDRSTAAAAIGGLSAFRALRANLHLRTSTARSSPHAHSSDVARAAGVKGCACSGEVDAGSPTRTCAN